MSLNKQKEIAIQCLDKLGIYKPYVTKFKNTGMPCFFEHFAGFWADQEPELYKKINEVEEEFGCLVYAVIHEITDYGEMWSMLCVPWSRLHVPEYSCVDDLILTTSKIDTFYAFTYTWNKSNPILSEFGDIAVRSALGGIKRVG